MLLHVPEVLVAAHAEGAAPARMHGGQLKVDQDGKAIFRHQHVGLFVQVVVTYPAGVHALDELLQPIEKVVGQVLRLTQGPARNVLAQQHAIGVHQGAPRCATVLRLRLPRAFQRTRRRKPFRKASFSFQGLERAAFPS